MPTECIHHAVYCIYLQLRDAAENGKAADVARLLKSGANMEVKEDWVRVSARLLSRVQLCLRVPVCVYSVSCLYVRMLRCVFRLLKCVNG